MTRCFALKARAMAYSATAVFPAEVCADTKTDSFRSCGPVCIVTSGNLLHMVAKMLEHLYCCSSVCKLRRPQETFGSPMCTFQT